MLAKSTLRIAVVAAVLLFCFALTDTVSGQRLRLRSKIDPGCQAPTGLPDLKYADIWADGNIAVQGSYNCRGVFIYDLTDPDNPVLASVYDPSPRQAFVEAIVIGNRGYFGSAGPFASTAAEFGDGVHIVDLTNPYNPVLIGKVNAANGNGYNGIHEMNVHNGFLIENYNHVSNKIIKIIDVRNPAAPMLKWSLTPQDATWVHAAHIRGDRLYLSGWGGKIEIYDISGLDAQAPRLLGTIVGDNTNHSSWTSEDGDYLYSCREIRDGDLRVYDVRDPAAPLLKRVIKTSDLGLNAVSPHNPIVMGNYLYVSWYQAGVQVFDITDRISPRRIAQYDTYPSTFAPPAEGERGLGDLEPWDMICGGAGRLSSLPTRYEGNWTVFPFLGQNKIIAGDMEHGLFVLDGTRLAGPAKNTVSDFDGDGKTDLSVFRPATSDWEFERTSDSSVSLFHFGVQGDVPAPGDYDGDGRTEAAVFRPSEGVWYLERGGSFIAVRFGAAGDIPVPGDYDADGRTDVAVWRPSNGGWYIERSTLGFIGVSWGIPQDKPVPGDYDGDGKTDVAIWRPGNGVWYVLQSSSTTPLYWHFGISSDKPIRADFDGNGVSDFAVYRPSEGNWYALDPRAVPHERSFVWGIASDEPVPADYDGDGKTDIAVFRASTREWYIQNSSGIVDTRRVFGLIGDVAAPSLVNPH